MPDMQLSPQDAATGCAGCTHPAAMHEVGVDDWRCLVSGCTCAGFNQIEFRLNPALPIEVVPDVADAAALAAAQEQLAAANSRIESGEMDDAIAAGVEAAAAALDAGTDPVEATRAAFNEKLPPCPRCGAPWRDTELVGAARHGGGYLTRCHACGHEWDNPHASHGARAESSGSNTDVIAAAVEHVAARYDATAADLPVRRRTPPPRPKPTPPKRPEGLALRFARAIAADPPPPGEWVRLDQRVSRAIVNEPAREFAEAFGLRLSVRLDHEDPDDPTSPRYHHLFCQVLDPDDTEDVKIEGRP